MLEREGILSQLVQCGDACCLTEETLCNCPLQMYTPNLDAAERRRETLQAQSGETPSRKAVSTEATHRSEFRQGASARFVLVLFSPSYLAAVQLSLRQRALR